MRFVSGIIFTAIINIGAWVATHYICAYSKGQNCSICSSQFKPRYQIDGKCCRKLYSDTYQCITRQECVQEGDDGVFSETCTFFFVCSLIVSVILGIVVLIILAIYVRDQCRESMRRARAAQRLNQLQRRIKRDQERQRLRRQRQVQRYRAINQAGQRQRRQYGLRQPLIRQQLELGQEQPAVLQNSSHEQCCICLQDYKNVKQSIVRKCGHKFHKYCIDLWKSKGQYTCPLCKAIQ